MVPQSDMQKDIVAFQPLFDDLQKRLGIPVDLITPSSYGAVIEGLLSGNVDLARLGPASYISAKRQDKSIMPFASVSRNVDGEEQAFYYSLLISRKETPNLTISALRGKKLALVDPDSTSGALIPRQAFVLETKIPIERYFGQINYSGSHDQSLTNVISRQADAAFISSTTLNAFNKQARENANKLQVLWRSKPIPRDPFVLRDSLCPDIKKKIKDVFLSNNGAANQELMKRLFITRFIAVTDVDYKILHDLP